MTNKSKSLLVLGVVLFGSLIASPNLFKVDPAIDVSREDGEPVRPATVSQVTSALSEADIPYLDTKLVGNVAQVRFPDVNAQERASETLSAAMKDHVSALTLAPRTPHWMQAIGLKPMSLGLDLRGGVHFLFQVNLQGAIDRYLGVYMDDVRTALRDVDIRHTVSRDGNAVLVAIQQPEDVDRAEDIIRGVENDPLSQRLVITRQTVDGKPGFRVEMTQQLIQEREDFAIEQNTITLRNRVNELGVSETAVARQGRDRILVELAGVQDANRAKQVLGGTASLEFRLVNTEDDPYEAEQRGRAPLGSELTHMKEGGAPILLRRSPSVSGDQLVDATPTYQQGQPVVSVRLNQQGAKIMREMTLPNVGKPMAVLYIEDKPVFENGELIRTDTVKEVISAPTIRDVLSARFVIEGLTPFEAQNLALQLRAGSLAAPIVIVEERTIGPSLGQDNIDKGRMAVIVGFLVVIAYMAFYYRLFGMIANVALFANLILIVALLSLLGAQLTLPGIAGIVLTVGMAVDANVLIFERIREELRNGNSPLASIRAGYEKAFSTIADANITTLIAALVLFFFGTGPVKGFAVTLAFGIITSMFTAIVGTRVIVDMLYGGRRQVSHLSIGGGARHAAA